MTDVEHGARLLRVIRKLDLNCLFDLITTLHFMLLHRHCMLTGRFLKQLFCLFVDRILIVGCDDYSLSSMAFVDLLSQVVTVCAQSFHDLVRFVKFQALHIDDLNLLVEVLEKFGLLLHRWWRVLHVEALVPEHVAGRQFLLFTC